MNHVDATTRTILASAVLLAVWCKPLRATPGDGFLLRDGDVYMIYGDSITDHSVYSRTIENYVLTRFPDWNVTFYNHAWSADVAHNLGRCERDVLPFRPTVFSECMGMNDGASRAITSDTVKRYRDAYRKMIPMLRSVNPDMRIALISAIPYENRGRNDRGDGAYAQTLRVLARVKQDLADELGVRYVGLFDRYAAKMGMGKVIYPDFVLSGDGVHPGAVGQTIIAMEILKGIGADPEIATLSLDLSTGVAKVVDRFRCAVRNLAVGEDGTITFERLAQALPCPIEATTATDLRFLDAVNFSDEINRDILRITGLTLPAYDLKINGVSIAVYSAVDLYAGANVAKPMSGPLWDQAMAVAQATRRRMDNHRAKWRELWLKRGDRWQGAFDRSDKQRAAELDARAGAAIADQHRLNQPNWTTFTLTPVEAKPDILPKPITYTSMGAGLAANMSPLDWTTTPVKLIDLRGVVNRAFADEAADDGRGGWSDQGPNNDLRNLPVGRQTFAGVPFDIIDPAGNGGKSMLVLTRRPGPEAPAGATIQINAKAEALVLLHAAAWFANPRRGVSMKIHYEDGESVDAALTGEALADWWRPPGGLPRAVVAWRGKNAAGGAVGVCYAPILNPRPDALIKSIEMSVPENAQFVFGLLAVTALPRE